MVKTTILKHISIVFLITCFIIISPITKADQTVSLNYIKSKVSSLSSNIKISNTYAAKSGTTAIQAHIPSNTIIIGNNAYNIRYLFDKTNCDEIKQKLSGITENKILFKLNNEWEDLNGNPINSANLPQVDYKDQYGNIITYGAGDGGIINTVYDIVTFEDPTFENIIREKINKPTGDILKSDISSITTIDASGKGVKSLKGIENLEDLTSLNLSNNEISDISELKGLKNLTSINLSFSLNLTQIQIDDLKAALPNCNISYSKAVSGIALNLKEASLIIDDTLQLTAYVSPIDAADKNVKWISSDSTVATVDSTGKVKALKPGTADITVTTEDGTRQAVCKFTVCEDSAVTFEDKNLENAIRKVINKSTGDILKSDLEHITSLNVQGNNIKSLNGIENLTNLSSLILDNNQISDINTLSSLTNLTELNLSNNKITDISSISGLTNLTELYLHNNQINNISPISSLTNLTELYIGGNQISDISSLKGLNKLNYLHLSYNLNLTQAQIDNLQSYLPNCDIVYNNTVTAINLNLQQTSLIVRGTIQLITNVFPTDPSNSSVSWSSSDPTVASVNSSGMVTALKSGTANITATTIYGNKQSICKVTVTGEDSIVTFGDLNLESVIRKNINKPTGDILKSDVCGITQLEANGKNIKSLTGLENLSNLTELNLDNNKISGLSALSGLSNLSRLDLGWNTQISDISVLKGLPSLTSLDLSGSNIDISQLSGLTYLTELRLGSDRITDIAALKELANLSSIDLSCNQICDINTLSSLPNLTSINLSGNRISNISVLSSLPKLIDLNLGSNSQISDFNVINNLKNLKSLDLSFDKIGDTSLLNGLLSLTNLNLSYTQISNINALKELANLKFLYLCDDKIDDYSVLGYLKNLESLGISNIKPTDINILIGLKNLINININDSHLTDINFLKELPNLTSINLDNNNINDISVLSNFPSLYSLCLNNNNVSDINALRGLSNLSDLQLDNNNISDINALSGLSNLNYLQLNSNNINDINALSSLSNLNDLQLDNNNISDISALSSLSNLNYLNINSNKISSISSLSGLSNLTNLQLNNNAVNDISILKGLTNLKYIDLCYSLNLTQAEVNDLKAALPDCYINYYQAALPTKIELELKQASLVAGSSIQLSANLEPWNALRPIKWSSNNPDVAAVDNNGHVTALKSGTADITATTAFGNLKSVCNVTVSGEDSIITFDDSNLESIIREKVGKPTGDIYKSDVDGITSLNTYQKNISKLGGIENLVNLTDLELSDNQISDISVLKNFDNLNYINLLYSLNLNQAQIDDLQTALPNCDIEYSKAELPTAISLNYKEIPLVVNGSVELYATFLPSDAIRLISWSSSDPTVAAVDSNGTVKALKVGTADITATTVSGDIKSVSKVTVTEDFAVTFEDSNLENVIRKKINKSTGDIFKSDVNAITDLNANNNNITSLKGIDYLTYLTQLELNDNQISDISALNNLKNLSWLELSDNQISDISTLKGLTDLHYINLTYSLNLTQAQIDDLKTALPNCALYYSKTIVPTAIELNLKQASLVANNSIYLSVSVSPANAINKVKWSSSDSTVATVDNFGNVKALKSGTAKITATTEYGNKQSVCTVTVSGEDSVITFDDLNLENVIRKIINKPTGTIFKSDVDKITYLDAGAKNISSLSGIENLTNLTQLELGYNLMSDISELGKLTSLTNLGLSSNQITDISVLNSLANLKYINLRYSLNLTQAQINNLQTALPNCTIDYDNAVIPTGAELNLKQASLIVNGSAQLYVITSPANSLSQAKWSSSDSTVATVDSSGYVTALKAGTAYIIATTVFGNIQTDCKITVSEDSVVTFSDPNLESVIRQNIGIPTGDILKSNLDKITSLCANNENITSLKGIENLTNLTLLELDGNSISDISELNGLVNLNSLYLSNNQITDISTLKNLTRLTTVNLSSSLNLTQAQIDDLQTTLPNCFIYYSKAAVPTSVELNLKQASLIVNDSIELSATLLPSNAFGNVKWTSSDSTVVSVDSNGKITALKAGAADITATTVYGNKQTVCKVTVISEDSAITFDDSNLESVIRGAINKPTGDILKSDVDSVTSIDANNKNISSLKGIENISNLTELHLSNNQLTDISILKGLVNLKDVDLSNSLDLTQAQIDELQTALPNCTINYSKAVPPTAITISTDQTFLITNDSTCLSATLSPSDAFGNVKWTSSDPTVATVDSNGKVTALKAGSTDIIAAAEYGNIQANCKLTVEDDAVVTFDDKNLENVIRQNINKATGDILKSDLIKITYLSAENNNVTSLNGIQNLVNLNTLEINYDKIDDISVLSSLTKLTELDYTDNQITDISVLKSLVNLQRIDLSNSLNLTQSQIDDLQTALPNCDIQYNQAAKPTAVSLNYTQAPLVVNGLVRLTATLSPSDAFRQIYWSSSDPTVATVDIDGTIHAWKVGTADITANTVSDDIKSVSKVTVTEDCPVTFDDSNLESAIRNVLYKSTGDILKSDVIRITYFDADNSNITSLKGIDTLTYLTDLHLNSNQISDINILGTLTNLNSLYLNNNKIIDITALKSLTNLTYIDLRGNLGIPQTQIDDLQAALPKCTINYK